MSPPAVPRAVREQRALGRALGERERAVAVHRERRRLARRARAVRRRADEREREARVEDARRDALVRVEARHALDARAPVAAAGRAQQRGLDLDSQNTSLILQRYFNCILY